MEVEPVAIEMLVQEVEYPDFAAMPDHVHGIPMPRGV